MKQEIKDQVKKDMISAGIFFIFPKENELGYSVYLSVLNSIENLQVFGAEYFEANTCAGPRIKQIIYKYQN